MPSGVSVGSAPFPCLCYYPLVTFYYAPSSDWWDSTWQSPNSHPDLQTESHKDNHQESPLLLPFDKEPPTVHLEGRLLPVPKASQTIEEAHFVELAECLSLYWENDDQIESIKFKHEIGNSILRVLARPQHVRIAIISCNEPHYRVVYLLAYQHLVIQEYNWRLLAWIRLPFP